MYIAHINGNVIKKENSQNTEMVNTMDPYCKIHGKREGLFCGVGGRHLETKSITK